MFTCSTMAKNQNKARNAVIKACGPMIFLGLAVPCAGAGDKTPTPVTVTNIPTISVQQSGRWTVHVSDTPTVKLNQQTIASMMRQTADSTKMFLKTVSFNIENGTTQNNVTIAVPEGKRLVIEHVSARAQGPEGQRFIAQIQANVSHTESSRGVYWLEFLHQGTFSGIDVFTANNPMHVYAEPGNPPVLFVATRSGISGTAFIEATVSGYLTNLR